MMSCIQSYRFVLPAFCMIFSVCTISIHAFLLMGAIVFSTLCTLSGMILTHIYYFLEKKSHNSTKWGKNSTFWAGSEVAVDQERVNNFFFMVLSFPSKSLKWKPCSFQICLKDATFLQQFSWSVLVVDEAHSLKNQNSLLFWLSLYRYILRMPQQFSWSVLIVDEAHSLKNQNSLLFWLSLYRYVLRMPQQFSWSVLIVDEAHSLKNQNLLLYFDSLYTGMSWGYHSSLAGLCW